MIDQKLKDEERKRMGCQVRRSQGHQWGKVSGMPEKEGKIKSAEARNKTSNCLQGPIRERQKGIVVEEG